MGNTDIVLMEATESSPVVLKLISEDGAGNPGGSLKLVLAGGNLSKDESIEFNLTAERLSDLRIISHNGSARSGPLVQLVSTNGGNKKKGSHEHGSAQVKINCKVIAAGGGN